MHCAYLTDGGYGGQSTQVRMRETIRALSLLGVKTSFVHFLGSEHDFHDGALHTQLMAAADALDELFMDSNGFESMYLPAWEAGHQDHDAVHLLGECLAHVRGVSNLRQFPLYHGADLPGPLFRVLSPLPQNGPVDVYRASMIERMQAIRLCLLYRSQWRTWIGLLPFFAWKMLMHGEFPVQPVNGARLSEPPHSGKPLYERRGALEAKVFFAEANAFLARRDTFSR